jgi:hypothetical protein
MSRLQVKKMSFRRNVHVRLDTHRDENVVLPPCGVLEYAHNQRPTRGRGDVFSW